MNSSSIAAEVASLHTASSASVFGAEVGSPMGVPHEVCKRIAKLVRAPFPVLVPV